ncbi:ABC transporter permease [Massilia yuzhufengensis]|uniref:Putative ABC transport system permease protein n=1 Tax=Massilia yuzhufengensis TaxID=1164594 RepID=A0A1I1ML69_9BURK|nr:FtsX-like permease family protein [Massilia yuzhufengensis]SFC83938.1 putative ABC transport system permease protein [Massilia yuzhufengensis]
MRFSAFRQSLRMTARDWRAGELRFLLVALIIAVSALSSVGFFIDRMRAGLNRDAHQLLGADLLVNADDPIQKGWREEARRRGLLVAETVTFQSMAQAGQGDASSAQLAAVKAVSSGYPLRGQLTLTTDPEQASRALGQKTTATPTPGTVWVDANLLPALRTSVGATIQLGDKQFRIAQLIATEPDKGASFANFAPRVMLSLEDLAATGLVDDFSRVSYRMQVASPSRNDMRAVVAYEKWLRADIAARNVRGVRIETLENGRPEMRATLDRADSFLSLVGLLSAMLAAVAVAMAARRFMQRHLDACAMLRCLGMTQNQVGAMYLIEFAIVGLVGSLLGVLVGFGAHFILLELIGSLLPPDLPPVSLLPALQGVATGMLLLVGFALPPVLQLRNVPHNRVIRREQAAPQPLALATYGLGVGVFLALLLWQAGDTKLALMTAGGFLGGLGVFALVAWLGLRLLRRLRGVSSNQSWRFAITSLQRRPGATVVQVVSLSLGLMALLLLTVVRGDLMSAWRMATPPDAPNRFIINIQPDQAPGVERQLVGAGVKNVLLYPMIRGRLTAINGKQLTRDTYQNGEARRMAEREFNLSTVADLPETNEVVAGSWYRDAPGVAEASVEQKLAGTLGLKLGDTMRFDMGGMPVEAKVTSLRKLEWGTMRANFFVIINPAAMANAPKSYMTAFHLPGSAGKLTNTLTREYPNLSVIDVSGIIRQLQEVLDQVVVAVEFLFMFTLASGVLVLYAALMGSQSERTREGGLLRALGATRGQLATAQRIEFVLVGSLSGVLAASGAALMGWVLAEYVFKFAWRFEPGVWLAGVVVGALCALVGGWLGLRSVLRQPPLQTLREA